MVASKVSLDDVVTCNVCYIIRCDNRLSSIVGLLFLSSLSFHHKHKTTMSDEVFPDSVKDFVFDLHDASRRSFIASEEQALYSGTFREITAKVS